MEVARRWPVVVGTSTDDDGGMQFRSAVMRRLVEDLRRVAPDDGCVLLRGETGVGKSALAGAVHRWSGRPGAFRVHPAGADPEKWRAALFGHVKGAYTGAEAARAGILSCARGGTVFLDEVGDLDVRNQVDLLTVLDRRIYSPLGSDEELRCEARIMAATNHDLRELRVAGRFRREFEARLADWEFVVPSLRDRPDDVEPIAIAVAVGHNCGITADAIRRLEREPWPDNVRELVRIVKRASVWCGGPGHVIDQGHVEAVMALGQPVAKGDADPETMRLRWALEAAGGDQGKAAALLGLARSTFQDHCRARGVRAPRGRGAPKKRLAPAPQPDGE